MKSYELKIPMAMDTSILNSFYYKTKRGWSRYPNQTRPWWNPKMIAQNQEKVLCPDNPPHHSTELEIYNQNYGLLRQPKNITTPATYHLLAL